MRALVTGGAGFIGSHIVDGALAASVFHTGALQIPELKQFLRTQAIEVRP